MSANMIPERYRQYEPVVHVAAANFAAVPGDKAATLKKMEATIREAASQGCLLYTSDAADE